MTVARRQSIPLRMSRDDRIRVGDLNEQVRLGTSGLPVVDAAPRIRVRLGSQAHTEACELWVRAGQTPVLRRLCTLPAGVGMRLRLVEKAIENAGFNFPRTDLQMRARWRRLHSQGEISRWFELELNAPLDRRSHRHQEPRG